MSAVGHVMLGTMDVHHHWTKVRKSLKAKQTNKDLSSTYFCFRKLLICQQTKKNFES